MRLKTKTVPADALINEKHIGERIKKLRLKKSMGLVELGAHTGLSPSFLSQLETGRVIPTLRNLARIAMVFSKDISYFFEEEPAPVFAPHRRQERVRLPQGKAPQPSFCFESLGYKVADRSLDPYWAEFTPLPPEAKITMHSHPGLEFLYVISGQLEIRLGEKIEVLSAGDSLCFDGSLPHGYRGAGTKSAEAIVVTAEKLSSSDRTAKEPTRITSGSPAKPGLRAS
ncbi:MAG TPA: XRE family transcriptional regulator [Terriglobales bacterium]